MQKTFINYKDIIDSYEAINKDFAILPSGVYRGFDSIEKTSTGIRIRHNQTGATFTYKDGTQTNNIGVIKSPQGVIILEDESIELPISAASTSKRIDVIIMEHQRGDIVGGSVAIPSVIQGTPNAGVPTINDTGYKTIIGYLLVNPDNTYYYERAKTPYLANNDFHNLPNKFSKQLSLSIYNSIVDINNSRLTIGSEGNIYHIRATSLMTNILSYISQKTNPITGVSTEGTEFVLINTGQYIIQILDKDFIIDNNLDTPHEGYTYIKTFSSDIINLMPGGMIKLIEDNEDGNIIWKMISFIDSSANPYNMAKELKDKAWGDNFEFVEAVKEVILNNPIATSKRMSPITVSGGIIQNGLKATHLNIYNVNVAAGISEITGVQSDFIVGTKVIFNFNVAEPFVVLRQTLGIKGFSSPIRFDYEIKTGSTIECVQLSDGLYVLNGTPYINWVSPSITGINHTVLPNHTIKYAVYPDGFIRFTGIAQLSGNGSQISFKMPNIFRSPIVNMNGVFNFITVNPHIMPLTKYHSMLYTEEMTEGFNPVPTGFFTFSMSLSNTAQSEGIDSIDFNLNGLQIPYK